MGFATRVEDFARFGMLPRRAERADVAPLRYATPSTLLRYAHPLAHRSPHCPPPATCYARRRPSFPLRLYICISRFPFVIFVVSFCSCFFNFVIFVDYICNAVALHL